MIASMAAVGLGSGLGSSTTDPPDVVENDETPVPTPASQTFPDGPAPVIDATEPYKAILTTSEGEIEITFVQDAPDTVNSFAFLAAKNFYDGTVIFFKDEFFGQGGDPTCVADDEFVCTGLGGPGYTLTREESATGHVQWAVVAPAIGGGDDAIHGSQFRILLEADERDLAETVFGVVTRGQEIIEALPDMQPCSLVDVPDCNPDLTGALVIEDVQVVPAN
jgi:cyclophilin family peptidyl-prolyl cis-trans isomerase